MYKRKFIILISLLLISIIFLPSVKAEEEMSEDLFYELIKTENEKPEIEIPDYEKVEFDNGLVAYLVKDSEHPVVEVTGFIEGGRRQEKSDIAGISDIMVEMMSTGTKNLGEEEYAREKEVNGIDISFGVNNDSFDFEGSALSSETDKLLSLLADSLQNPDFSASYFQRILQEQNQYLAQATVQVDPLLNSNFFKNIYENHPYSFANDIELKSSKLNSLSSKKLRNFYNNSIGPEKMVIAVVGDINIDESKKVLKDNFADWNKQDIEIRENEIEEMAYDEKKIVIVEKEDADQAHMKIGHNFPGHDFEKDTEFLMGNRILGQGGFSSRLMENIRSEKGYVYSIYSDTSYNNDGGVFYINTKVDHKKAPEVLKAVKDEMEAIKTGNKEITEEELSENINLYNGLLPSSYKHSIDIINEYIYETEFLGVKGDYLNSFIEEYNSLNADEVQKVMEENLKPDKLLTVVVGNSEKLESVFKEAGYEVEVIKSKQ
ncbi:MAG: M16 family metallopeptidase [Bacillota bacterium]